MVLYIYIVSVEEKCMKKFISVLLVSLLVVSVLASCGNQTETKMQPYAGKSFAFIGDSVTYGDGLQNFTNQYWMHLENNMGFGAVHNCGICGSCVSTQGTRGFEKSPLALRVNAIPRADIFVIFMGTNDFGCDVPIGTMDDTQDVSFTGAWNFVLNTLKSRHPDTKILLMTPLPRYSKSINALELKLDAYVDAIKEIGAAHQLPVIDLYTIMADVFTEENCDHLMPDKLHPNEAGHELLAKRIQAWLEEHAEEVLG